MGIKQRFASLLAKTSAEESLSHTWESTDGSNVIVFDGTNFLLTLFRHPQFPMFCVAVPRLREYREVLMTLLKSILDVCPGAEFHFLFDGLASSSELACKASEAKQRTVHGFVDKLECAEAFCQEGYAHRAMSTSTFALKRLLEEVLASLQDSRATVQHKIFWVHGRERDTDIATALHARKWNARLLFSDDSDFLLLCRETVIPSASLRLREGGVYGKPLSPRARCQALGASSMDELTVVAFLVGSDFNKPIMEVVAGESWQAVLSRAQDLLAGNETSGWQAAVRTLSDVADSEIDGFISNFDTSSYLEHKVEDHDLESWMHKGQHAFGITCSYPWRGGLDPVLDSFREWQEERLDGDLPARALLHPDRLLRAYARGHLSSGKLNLLRFRESGQRSCYSDSAEGQPVAALRRASSQRLVSFLSGPARDSWEDDDSAALGFPDAFFSASVTWEQANASYAKRLLNSDIAKLTELKKQAFQVRFDEARKIVVDARIEKLREELVGLLDYAVFIEEGPLPPADEDFDWMWDCLEVQDLGGHVDQEKVRASNFFYLVTGEHMSKQTLVHQHLVARCMTKKVDNNALSLLYILCLCILGRNHVVPEHVQQLCASLGVDAQFVQEMPSPKFMLEPRVDKCRLATAALVLGDLVTWLLSQMQDCFCLCGGEGLLFPLVLPLDGGPVVLTDQGQVHKASHGYRVAVSAPQGEHVPDSLFPVLAGRLSEMLPKTFSWEMKRGRQSWLKIRGVSGVQAFGLHRRIVISDGVPWLLNVSALD
mmetsp:Transcript_13163/g.37591  ORF Transcript_13163/g.37591 Transcript_13163/m.37591 type:complete len:771 (+) Transcript_13163:57-2369(+)